MHILIIGAAGMVGRKLTERLVRDGALGGKAITRATLHDIVEPPAPAGAPPPRRAPRPAAGRAGRGAPRMPLGRRAGARQPGGGGAPPAPPPPPPPPRGRGGHAVKQATHPFPGCPPTSRGALALAG